MPKLSPSLTICLALVAAIFLTNAARSESGVWSNWLEIAPKVEARVKCEDPVYLVEVANLSSETRMLEVVINSESRGAYRLAAASNTPIISVFYEGGCRGENIDVEASVAASSIAATQVPDHHLKSLEGTSPVTERDFPAEGQTLHGIQERSLACSVDLPASFGTYTLSDRKGQVEEVCGIDEYPRGSYIYDRKVIDCYCFESAAAEQNDCDVKCENRRERESTNNTQDPSESGTCSDRCCSKTIRYLNCCKAINYIHIDPVAGLQHESCYYGG